MNDDEEREKLQLDAESLAEPTGSVLKEEDDVEKDAEEELNDKKTSANDELGTKEEEQEAQERNDEPEELTKGAEKAEAAVLIKDMDPVDEANISLRKSIEDFNDEIESISSVSSKSEMTNKSAAIDDDETTEDIEELSSNERQDLISTCNSLKERYRSLRQQRMHFLTKIHEHFNRRKAKATENEERPSSGDTELLSVGGVKEKDLEQVMQVMADLRKELSSQKEAFSDQISGLKSQCEQRQTEVLAASKEFTDYRSNIALKSINSRTCKPFSKQELSALLQVEDKKEAILAEIRLEHLRLQNVCNKLEKELTSKEQLVGGLQLIDFEQLKIENQTYNEKIEERVEELNKLRKKVTSTVQVTTHLREKLEAVKQQRSKNKDKLDQLDVTLTKKRDKLTKMKQLRNKIKSQNEKLEDECGLLIKPNLLKHYGESMEKIEELKEKQGSMKYQIAHYRMRNKMMHDRILKTQEQLNHMRHNRNN